MSVTDAVWMAFGLLLVMEGLLPAINPNGWRSMFEQLIQLGDDQIRLAGLVSMVAGLLVLWFLQ